MGWQLTTFRQECEARFAKGGSYVLSLPRHDIIEALIFFLILTSHGMATAALSSKLVILTSMLSRFWRYAEICSTEQICPLQNTFFTPARPSFLASFWVIDKVKKSSPHGKTPKVTQQTVNILIASKQRLLEMSPLRPAATSTAPLSYLPPPLSFLPPAQT